MSKVGLGLKPYYLFDIVEGIWGHGQVWHYAKGARKKAMK